MQVTVPITVNIKVHGGALDDALSVVERIKKDHPNARINIEVEL